MLVPCVRPSSRSHPVDLDDEKVRPSAAPQGKSKDVAALKEKQAEELPPAPQESEPPAPNGIRILPPPARSLGLVANNTDVLDTDVSVRPSLHPWNAYVRLEDPRYS